MFLLYFEDCARTRGLSAQCCAHDPRRPDTQVQESTCTHRAPARLRCEGPSPPEPQAERQFRPLLPTSGPVSRALHICAHLCVVMVVTVSGERLTFGCGWEENAKLLSWVSVSSPASQWWSKLCLLLGRPCPSLLWFHRDLCPLLHASCFCRLLLVFWKKFHFSCRLEFLEPPEGACSPSRGLKS